MQETKAGEYVRLVDNVIRKIVSIDRHYINLDKEYYNKQYLTNYNCTVSERIIKSSKKIKDLIEEGDVLAYRLNNLSFIKIGEVKKYKDTRSFKEYLGIEGFSLEQIEILNVVTKEQFKSVGYEV